MQTRALMVLAFSLFAVDVARTVELSSSPQFFAEIRLAKDARSRAPQTLGLVDLSKVYIFVRPSQQTDDVYVIASVEQKTGPNTWRAVVSMGCNFGSLVASQIATTTAAQCNLAPNPFYADPNVELRASISVKYRGGVTLSAMDAVNIYPPGPAFR